MSGGRESRARLVRSAVSVLMPPLARVVPQRAPEPHQRPISAMLDFGKLGYTAAMRMIPCSGLPLAMAAMLASCGPTTQGSNPPLPSLSATQGPTSGPGQPVNPGSPAATPATTPPPQPAAESLEERHVSKSAGAAGGVTLLWPRIIPRDIVDENRDLAAALQQRMKGIVEKHLPGRAIDFRPEPERVCPKTGCAGVSVGLLLSRQGQGCLVLALISQPGVSPTRIVPWVGKVQLRADTVGFREWPESQITVADYIPCSSLLTTMDSQEANVAAALQAAAR